MRICPELLQRGKAVIFEQMHYAYEHTELFNVEIDRLKPYFGLGTGAFYVNFERHLSL